MLTLVALGLSAFAFSPQVDTWIGVEPDRVVRVHTERQRALRRGEAWQGFLADEGAGWVAVFDERTGLPASAWGPPADLGPLQDGASVEAAVRGFLARHGGLVGVELSDLSLRTLAYDEARDAWTVELAQVVPGAAAASIDGLGGLDGSGIGAAFDPFLDPFQTGAGLVEHARFDFQPSFSAQGPTVWRGSVLLRIVGGRLAWFSARTHPAAAELDPSVQLTAATALDVAIDYGPEPTLLHQPLGVRLVVLPMERWGIGVAAPLSATGTGLDYRFAWEVRTRTKDPSGLWVSFVDADSGELLHVYNEVRYVAGALTASHDLRTVDGNMKTSPLVDLELQGNAGDNAYTDDDGLYDLAASETASATLSGRRLRVDNQQGSDASTSFGGDHTWSASSSPGQAELDTWVFLHQVMDWRDLYAPEVNTGGQLVSNVNLNSTCNAYFDGSVNFYREGGGCNNTGRIADVNHHEWGHGFHYYSLQAGTFDGSMSEGIADTVAFFLSADNIVAPYFLTNGSGIRDVAEDRVYPDDVIDQVHTDGLIYAGAIWDLWEILESQHSEPEAYQRAVSVMANGIKTGPTLATAYESAILGDDDNGDLSDGTPNQCAIMEAFSAHGLGPAGLTTLLGFDHEPLGNQSAALSEYPLAASLLNFAPDCVDFELQTGTVNYRSASDESWQSVALSVAGDQLAGALPSLPAGTVVEYYIEGLGADGSAVTAPAGGEIAPYTFVVGELVSLYCEDFEASEGGFTHALLDGEDELGADDWIWGTPRGMGGDPDFAFSGDKVWGNDLGGGNYNGEYQNGKHNRLSSPEIDVTGYSRVVLQYRRWLNVEDGYYDQARIVMEGEDLEGTDDDAVVWANHVSGSSNSDHDEHHQDEEWISHSVVLDGISGGKVRLGWEILSDEGLTMGGWTIDDVCVYAVLDDSGAVDTGGDGGESGADGGDATDGDWEVRPSECGCAAGPRSSKGGALALLLLVAGLVRRRRG